MIRSREFLNVHLIDGTYELFRHFYGLRRFTKTDRPLGAVVGVLNTLLEMIEGGATHVGVATDHVIESFRNSLWSGYKTGDGIEPALWAAIAGKDRRVEQVCIWTPDKDLAQCVRGSRVVQIDRKSKIIRNAEGVEKKFGVPPELIPDYLALVGDSADGYPGLDGIGPKGASSLLLRYGRIEKFPEETLGKRRELALLFKQLATLKTDAPLFSHVGELRWAGPTKKFAEWSERLGDKVIARASKAAAATAGAHCP